MLLAMCLLAGIVIVLAMALHEAILEIKSLQPPACTDTSTLGAVLNNASQRPIATLPSAVVNKDFPDEWQSVYRGMAATISIMRLLRRDKDVSRQRLLSFFGAADDQTLKQLSGSLSFLTAVVTTVHQDVCAYILLERPMLAADMHISPSAQEPTREQTQEPAREQTQELDASTPTIIVGQPGMVS